MRTRVACVDIGSTWTKAALVALPDGSLLASEQAPTTLDDVVTGVLAATFDFGDVDLVACSSAGGGLRLAVVGYEQLISAEAGHRAALSAGARVVHVAAGRLDEAGLAAVRAVRADVYCVPDADAEQATLHREAVGVPAQRRTVEGDLGVQHSVGDLRAAARAEGLRPPGDDALTLGEAAATIALRRHLRAEAAYGPGGAGARGVGLVVLSGGVFRLADPAALNGVIARLAADRGGAGGVLGGTDVVVDRVYVLAAAGLLAREHPVAAAGLLSELAGSVPAPRSPTPRG